MWPYFVFCFLFIILAGLRPCCGLRASVAAAHTLSSCGIRVQLPRGMGDPTRDRTHVPCIGRHFLNHWIIREVPLALFEKRVAAEIISLNEGILDEGP